MYPHVRQLTTHWPEHEPGPHTEIPPDSAPSPPHERPRRRAGPPRHKLALAETAYATIPAGDGVIHGT